MAGRGGDILWADLHVDRQEAFEWNPREVYSRNRSGSGRYPAFHDSQRFFHRPLGCDL